MKKLFWELVGVYVYDFWREAWGGKLEEASVARLDIKTLHIKFKIKSVAGNVIIFK